MKACTDKNCSACRNKVAQLDKIDDKYCKISDRARNQATKNSKTYYQMQACAQQKGCAKCRKRVQELDAPTPICNVPSTEKRTAKYGDSTYYAMLNCIKKNNCRSCRKYLPKPPQPPPPPPPPPNKCKYNLSNGERLGARPGRPTWKKMESCGCPACRRAMNNRR